MRDIYAGGQRRSWACAAERTAAGQGWLCGAQARRPGRLLPECAASLPRPHLNSAPPCALAGPPCRARRGRVPRLLLGGYCHARRGGAAHHAPGGAAQRRLAALAWAAAVRGAARQPGSPAAAGRAARLPPCLWHGCRCIWVGQSCCWPVSRVPFRLALEAWLCRHRRCLFNNASSVMPPRRTGSPTIPAPTAPRPHRARASSSSSSRPRRSGRCRPPATGRPALRWCCPAWWQWQRWASWDTTLCCSAACAAGRRWRTRRRRARRGSWRACSSGARRAGAMGATRDAGACVSQRCGPSME